MVSITFDKSHAHVKNMCKKPSFFFKTRFLKVPLALSFDMSQIPLKGQQKAAPTGQGFINENTIIRNVGNALATLPD